LGQCLGCLLITACTSAVVKETAHPEDLAIELGNDGDRYMTIIISTSSYSGEELQVKIKTVIE
jgi:hypothetical protein